MSDLLAAVTALMTAVGLSTTDVRRGPLTDTDDAPDETALIDYPGVAPESTYCGPQTRLPRVAVQVRRATRPLACARSEQIYSAFAAVKEVTAGGVLFHEIIPQGEPAWLDEREGVTIYTTSYEIRRAA